MTHDHVPICQIKISQPQKISNLPNFDKITHYTTVSKEGDRQGVQAIAAT